MLPPCSEISKTGEEIKCVIKIIYPERQPHVMYKEFKIIGFKLFSFPDTVFRKVNACYLKPLARQLDGMPSFSTGHIKHFTVLRRLQVIYELIYEGSSLQFIPLKIQL